MNQTYRSRKHNGGCQGLEGGERREIRRRSTDTEFQFCKMKSSRVNVNGLLLWLSW